VQLLTKAPNARLGSSEIPGEEREIKDHLFYRNINWQKLQNLEVQPPFKPRVVSKFLMSSVLYLVIYLKRLFCFVVFVVVFVAVCAIMMVFIIVVISFIIVISLITIVQTFRSK